MLYPENVVHLPTLHAKEICQNVSEIGVFSNSGLRMRIPSHMPSASSRVVPPVGDQLALFLIDISVRTSNLCAVRSFKYRNRDRI